ncbi:lipoprotein-releasing ABC transporter permease subunit [Desulfatirhabdium butyrativorans]|uniref:lipoprotein-releasing ABC transporter permease subunit n=1 Tax=Desulfatirhabdium butyrativorans TaxID=340467 RepID=UPI00041BC598|nr:lipoprotein-releasing ABC transporter permease subunit [Desulfatirhabdium butyrativorans]
MRFEWFIAGRYLRAKQRHSFISLITLLSIAGVTVGVMALIVVIAVMAGFEADLKSKILGVESHIVVMKQGGRFEDYEKVRGLIGQIPGVIGTTPFLTTQAMIRSAGAISGTIVRGIDPGSVDQVLGIVGKEALDALRQDQGADAADAQPAGIVLGKELARNLGVVKGDIVHIISPRGMITPAGFAPSMKRFRVVGRFESGMYEYDGSLAFVHLQVAQSMLGMEGAVTGIEVRLADVYQARSIGRSISGMLGKNFWVRDWMQMNRNLFSALKLEKTVMFIILALIILVAAFNIASSLIMMVMEKTRDIAILKAMGATDASIRRIFVLKGMIIGVVGTVLGGTLGVILCVLLKRYQFIDLPGDVYYLSKLPVLLKTGDILTIAVSSLVICFLSTLYPSRQAARLNPVEAIRHG